MHPTKMSESERLGEAAEVTACEPTPQVTRVNVNIPSALVAAVAEISRQFCMNRTDVIVRALNREAYFARLSVEDPEAKFIVERSSGNRQEVVFI